MKITKRQLRRIIKEEKQKLVHETIADMVSMEDAVNNLVWEFNSSMDELFQEDPEMFAGRSTEKEWKLQVDAATEMLANELAKTVERVESMLHDGQFRSGGREYITLRDPEGKPI
tara:strand:- start:136 stop:480 length:345 start_codon:yes stop_codon:yes gene_type:complete